MSAAERIHPLRRWGIAVVLGILGLVINLVWVPNILTGETPRFLFGGVLVLVAFARLGPGPGFLTGTLTLLTYFLRMDASGWSTVVYLFEWSFIWWFARRFRSMVLAAPIFWLVIGGPLDLLFYGHLARIPTSYVGILFLKQLLNGTLNALVAELILILPATSRLLPDPDPPPRLRPALFGRLSLGFMALAVLSGLILARSSFDRTLREADAELVRLRQSAQEITLEFLSREALKLQGLAVELVVTGGDPPESGVRERIQRFHSMNTQFINLALVDSLGTARLNVPATDNRGDPIPDFTISGRGYFQEVRRTGAPTVSPLILGDLAIRSQAPEPILVLAVPVPAPDADFGGILLGALDASALGRELQDRLGEAATQTTVLDREDRVVWSGLDHRVPGAMVESLPEHRGGSAGDIFSYTPTVMRTRLDSLELNVHRASAAAVPLFELSVLRELPSLMLYREMQPAALRIGLLLLLAELLVIGTAFLITRQVASPLQGMAGIVGAVTAGRDPPPSSFSSLEDSGIAELSEAGRGLRAMAAAVAAGRKVSQEAVEQSEDRFRATFEQSAAGIALLDREGRILLVNRRYAAFLGAEPEALVGQVLADRTHPDDRGTETAALARLAEGDGPRAGLEIRTAERPDRWLDVSIARFRDRTEEGYVIQVAQDVTERKRLEDRLFQSSKLESVGRLAAGVAHDLNNMLTPILGYSRLALEESEKDSESEEWLEQVLQATDRARTLVGQLLAFGRRQTLRLEPVPINTAIREFQVTYGRLLRENVQLSLKLTEGLPPVEADPSQLQQVLINLAVNSQDALTEGGTIHVSTTLHRAEEEPPAIELRVWDTGPGIPETLLPKVFEPFFTTKGVGEGTGLGLASVHGIIRQMGGQIEAGTADGGGFLVRMLLPVADQPPSAETPDPRPREIPDSRLVVVVEDEESVRSLLGRALSSMGLEAHTFESGEAFTEALERMERPDLLLTDVVLPGIDGRVVRDRALERFPGLHTVFMSGYSREILEDDPGADGLPLLTKPFTLEELRATVARALGE